jgi:ATP-dependent Lhr-like helicase
MVDWMLEQGILWEEAGILALGRQGESSYGRKNFLELFSVFMSPPLFSILHGRQELGYVDEMTFLGKQPGPRVLLLGGRAWQVNHIDWQRRTAWVEATESVGRTRWKGAGQGLGFRMSRAIRGILAAESGKSYWSQRASERMGGIREQYAWLDPRKNIARHAETGELQWWTFAGNRVNAVLAHELAQATGTFVSHDNCLLTFESAVKLLDVEAAIVAVGQRDVTLMHPVIDDTCIDGLKFSDCLPRHLAIRMLEHRLRDEHSTRTVLDEGVRMCGQQ